MTFSGATPGQFFTQSRAADLNESGRPDVVFRADSTVTVMFDVTEILSKADAFGYCHDFDVYPAYGNDPASIMVIDGTGLYEVSIDNSVPSVPVWATTLLAPLACGAGSMIRTGDIDVDGDSDLVVYEATTKTFHTVARTPTGWVYIPAPFSIPEDALAFELINHDADASLELAVMTFDSVVFYELDGSPDTSCPTPPAGRESRGITIVMHQGLSVLAYLFSDTIMGNQGIGFIPEGQCDMGFVDYHPGNAISSMVATKVNTDDDDDLILNLGPTFEVGITHTTVGSNGPEISLSTMDVVQIPGFSHDPLDANPDNVGVVSIADVDGDGDTDLVAPSEASAPASDKNVHVIRSDKHDISSSQPVLATLTPYHLVARPAPQTSSLEVRLKAPALADMPTPNDPNSTLHMQVMIWEQENINVPIDAIPLSAMDAPVVAGTQVTFTCDLGESGTVFESLRLISARLVAVNSLGKITQRFAPANFIFWSHDLADPMGLAIQDYVTRLSSGRQVDVYISGGGGYSGGGTGGGGLPIECIGPHDDDDIPPRPPMDLAGTTSTGPNP